MIFFVPGEFCRRTYLNLNTMDHSLWYRGDGVFHVKFSATSMYQYIEHTCTLYHFRVITSEEAEEWFLKNHTSIYCAIHLTFSLSSWLSLLFSFFLPLFLSSQFSCVFAHFAQLRDFFWIVAPIFSICDSLRSVNWILIHWIQWISKFCAKSGDRWTSHHANMKTQKSL